MGELFAEIGTPQVLALGEITHVAANDLRDRLLPEYRVLSLDVMKGDESLQVAVLYAPDSDLVNFEEQAPLLAPMMPGSTRPMAVLDATSGAHTVRMVICHWQARFDAVGSRRTRARTADFLAGECYDFIVADHQNHHLVIVGDFNEEPYEEGLLMLNAHRHRRRAHRKPHRADRPVKRLHLYNTAWRLLGEQYPHPVEGKRSNAAGCAGTYYWAIKKSWHHFDQILVSGGLLGSDAPYIDETRTGVASTPSFLASGLPAKFMAAHGEFVGLSDHLPIFACIQL